MQFYLIGEHLPHSFSARIHGMISESCGVSYRYEPKELQREELAAFLRGRKFTGLNVTIPYKQAVIPFLDELTPQAEMIGAVNTVINREGKLIGDNTDYWGFQELARHSDISFAGARVLVLGRGGAAKAVRAAAMDEGAAEVVLTGRDTDFSILDLGRNFEIIVNATPLGMFPSSCEPPVNVDEFPLLQGVLDCIYNPLRTSLVIKAQMRGVKAEGGLYMLVAQAVAAASLFLEEELPSSLADQSLRTALTESIFSKLLEEKRNIVYIGMPSCGKSTYGRALAHRLGRAFVDTDSLIEERAGMPIPSIFEKYGEVHFRRLEASIISEISRWQGCVIATGGGTVLNPDNMLALRRNGHIIYLKAPLEELSTGGRRPLSSDSEALRRIYTERVPLYEKWADEVEMNYRKTDKS